VPSNGQVASIPVDHPGLEALRTPEVADRWYQQLVTMKKSAEAQLAAKSADDKEKRITLTLVAKEFPEKKEEMLRRADEARAGYLKWRAGVLRFRSGVEERLAEASWRRRMSVSLIPSALIDERNQLLSQVSALTDAIKTHRASMADLEEADEADELLWATLEEGPRQRCLGGARPAEDLARSSLDPWAEP
jgi:hypothetical protein